MAIPAQSEFAAYGLHDPYAGQPGARTATVVNGTIPAVWKPTGLFEIVFEPNSFGNEEGASRVNLNLRGQSEAVEWMQELDKWMVAHLTANSAKYLGKALTPEEVQARYLSAIKTNEKYNVQMIRTKLNLAGKSKTRLWDPFGKSREEPTRWVGCMVKACLQLKLYIMPGGREFGALVECVDLQVGEPTYECPF